MNETKAVNFTTLQVARGVAALLVVLFHATVSAELPACLGMSPAGGFFGFGHCGVDFFFVLSGFIITFIHFDQMGRRDSMPSYWRKRFVRVFPPFWAACLFALVVDFAGPSLQFPRVGKALLDSFLFVENPSAILGVAWTLRIEVFFYLVFSVFLLDVPAGLFVFLAWQGLVFWTNFSRGEYAAKTLLDVRCLHFSLGMLVAVALKKLPVRRPALLAMAGVLLFAANSLGAKASRAFLTSNDQILLWGIASALMLLGFCALESKVPIRAPRALLLLGDASYSIYLVHFPLIMLFLLSVRAAGLHASLPAEIWFALTLVFAVGGSLAFYRWVELPVLRGFKRLLTAPPEPFRGLAPARIAVEK